MKWWSPDEYPWSGNDTAGQWIADGMQWKGAQLFGQCDLAIESGGAVRADIPAGPITFQQAYEVYPWNDDTFDLVKMTGQEIINFIKASGCDAAFSSAIDVTAVNGAPTTVLFNGQPLDINHTYAVALSNYNYAHPPSGFTFSDAAPQTSPVLCRDGVIEFSQQFTASEPYTVGGPRYHLNTEFAGGYRAVVTMLDDNDTRPVYENGFIRFLSATPETVERLGSPQVPASLVNSDGTMSRPTLSPRLSSIAATSGSRPACFIQAISSRPGARAAHTVERRSSSTRRASTMRALSSTSSGMTVAWPSLRSCHRSPRSRR